MARARIRVSFRPDRYRASYPASPFGQASIRLYRPRRRPRGMTGDVITVNAHKYDGRIRRSWTGGLVSNKDGLITLLAEFSETMQHNDLGVIKAGTVSFEHFWLDRWDNGFHLCEPDGTQKAHHTNIPMP